MRIKMRTRAAGPEGVMLPGHEYDLDAAKAKPLIDGGYADLVRADPAAHPPRSVIETAAKSRPETAAIRTGKATPNKPPKGAAKPAAAPPSAP